MLCSVVLNKGIKNTMNKLRELKNMKETKEG